MIGTELKTPSCGLWLRPFSCAALDGWKFRQPLQHNSRPCAERATHADGQPWPPAFFVYDGSMFNPRKTVMVDRDKALRGRAAKMMVDSRHAIHGTPMEEPFPGMEM